MCVYHALVPTAVEALAGTGIPVAAVSTGFPAGLSPLEERVAEIRASVAAGAREIDIVITRAHVLTGQLGSAVRRGAAVPRGVRRRAHEGDSRHRRARDARQRRAREHGRDDGRRGLHQDVHRQGRRQRDAAVRLVMCRMIREYHERTGYAIGFKPAGGIRTAKNALEYLYLMKEELGDRWLRADLFRFGASALLTDIERQLEHFVTGRYSAAHRCHARMVLSNEHRSPCEPNPAHRSNAIRVPNDDCR